MKAKGKEVSKQEEDKLLNEIKARYETQTSPYYAAARLWVDAIIDPVQSRYLVSEAIRAANNNADIPEFKSGVFQV